MGLVVAKGVAEVAEESVEVWETDGLMAFDTMVQVVAPYVKDEIAELVVGEGAFEGSEGSVADTETDETVDLDTSDKVVADVAGEIAGLVASEVTERKVKN